MWLGTPWHSYTNERMFIIPLQQTTVCIKYVFIKIVERDQNYKFSSSARFELSTKKIGSFTSNWLSYGECMNKNFKKDHFQRTDTSPYGDVSLLLEWYISEIWFSWLFLIRRFYFQMYSKNYVFIWNFLKKIFCCSESKHL